MTSRASGGVSSSSATDCGSGGAPVILRRSLGRGWPIRCPIWTPSCAAWPSCIRGPASGTAGYVLMSSLRRAAPGDECAAAMPGWLPGHGGTRCATAGSSAKRKLQRQEIASHHRTADHAVAGAMGDDESRAWMPFHQTFDVGPREMDRAGLGVIGHLDDHVVGSADELLQRRRHHRVTRVAEPHTIALDGEAQAVETSRAQHGIGPGAAAFHLEDVTTPQLVNG